MTRTLAAGDGARIAWWSAEGGAVPAIAAWRAVGAATRPGEDGSPCVRVHRRFAQGIVGVFDGLGGAGARDAWQLPGDEKPLTGAHVAANVASLACHRWYADGERHSASLAQALHATLVHADELSNAPRQAIRGSAMRTMPTTVAVIRFEEFGDGIRAMAMSAGDSRCYLLRPATGLQQLSVDDTRVPDALVALRESPPMTQVAGADRPFELREAVHICDPPLVLLVATDGYFDYVETPHQLELECLRALAAAETFADWAEGLARYAAEHARDDASLAAACFGFADLPAFRSAFAKRLAALEQLEADTLQRADPARPEAREQARAEAWERYRTLYEALLEVPA